MVEEFSQPYLIQEELARLKGLIQDNKRLISEYPDELALKLNLISLENREADVLSELNEINKRLGIVSSNLCESETENKGILSPAIEYTLKGESVSLTNAPTYLLGKILINMQNLICGRIEPKRRTCQRQKAQNIGNPVCVECATG